MSKVAIIGNASGTGVFTVASPNSNVDRVLTLPDETGTVITTATTLIPSATNTAITLGTAVATTSGTSIDITGIPAGVKRVTVMLNDVSTNGTSAVMLQIGSGSILTTGYEASSGGLYTPTGAAFASYTTGFGVFADQSVSRRSGSWVISTHSGVVHIATHAVSSPQVGHSSSGAGVVTLGGAIDRIRLTTVGGTNTFDLGSVNISWEF
jgi:hypothetical protein